MYLAIIDGPEGYDITILNTFDEAFEYATKNNYGRNFRIAKEINYKITAEEL